MTTKFAGILPQLLVKRNENKQGRAKSPSLTPDYSPNHRKLEKPQVTSQVNQGNFIYYWYNHTINAWQYSQVFQVTIPQHLVYK